MAKRMDVLVCGQYRLYRRDKLSAASHADACSVFPVRYSAIFEALDDEVVRELVAISWDSRYHQGETIIDEGDDRTFCFNVVSGMVRLHKLCSDGTVQIYGFLLPGNLIGLPMPGPAICSADSIGPTVLRCLPVAPFQEILTANPDMYDYLLTELENLITNTQTHMY